jgi:hypothetical protein
MTLQELLISGLGGGIGSALITAMSSAWRTSKTETSARRAAFLESQIQKVYGPVYLKLLEMQRLAQKLIDELQAAGNKFEADRLEDQKETALADIRDMTTKIRDLNTNILTILHNNAPHIDVSDLSLVVNLFEDVTWLEIESADEFELVNTNGRYLIGNAWILRSELLTRFEVKYKAKSTELMKLQAMSRAVVDEELTPWWRRLPPWRSGSKQAA